MHTVCLFNTKEVFGGNLDNSGTFVRYVELLFLVPSGMLILVRSYCKESLKKVFSYFFAEKMSIGTLVC